MAKEIRVLAAGSINAYVVIQKLTSGVLLYWNTAASPSPGFEAYNSGHWSVYAIALTEGATGFYAVDAPALAADTYLIAVYARSGGSPATSDQIQGGFEFVWDGSAEVTLGDISTGGGGDATAANQALILAKLNTGKIEAVNPVGSDVVITLTQGDSYADADGRALIWTIEDYTGPSTGGLTVAFRMIPAASYGTGSATLTTTGTAAMVSTDAVFKVELTAAQTAALTPGKLAYVYQLVVTDGDGHVITEALSKVTVRGKV